MTDTTHTPEENLAFLRQLAHSGKEAPLMAGPYLIAGGAWFAAASLLQWPPLRDLLGLSLTQATFAWLIAAAGFALHLTVLIRRDRHKVENSANRVVNASWVGVGLGIFAFWLGVAAMAWRGRQIGGVRKRDHPGSRQRLARGKHRREHDRPGRQGERC